ncbi:MAG: hypothetical protein MHM6MM_000671 [Cercozoa sp. M6MM]
MGCCAFSRMSPEDRASQRRSRDMERELQRQRRKEMQIKKLLLLGAGESGKSTLFKQMITLYRGGFSVEDRKTFTSVVYDNCVGSMKTLIEAAIDLQESDGTYVEASNESIAQHILDLEQDTEVDMELAEQISRLWQDSGIQKTFSLSSKYQLLDSASYFFGRVADIGRPDYVPTEQDVLRTRVRTTGIVETAFEIENNLFKMFDVGGQRSERRKWIHCFEDVTSVIFVAAISEYDQMLYEDDETNRVHEALKLFDDICNSRWFKKMPIILFLNKKDLFEEKIQKVPLTVCFPEFEGPQTFERGCAYMQVPFSSTQLSLAVCQTDCAPQEKFEELGSGQKQIYTHVTCATDTKNIAHVFNAVKDILIRESLVKTGLIPT